MAFIDYQKIGVFSGERYVVRIENNDEILIPSDEWFEYQKVRRLEIELEKSSIPLHIIKYSIPRDYIGDKSLEVVNRCIKYVDHFQDRFHNKCLYFYGDSGTQKTTIAHWIGMKLIEQNKKVRYVTMNTLATELTQEQFSDSSKDRLTDLRSSDLIILDRAFDKNQVTMYASGYQLSFIDSFLRERIENEQKAMIIISNNPVEDISKHKFNSDIQDLIRRFVVPIDGALLFQDNYSKKELFNVADIWN